MKLAPFIEGINILRKYYDGQDGYHLGAEHDIIYCFATNLPVTEPDYAKLRELGWFQPDVPDEDGYQSDEGWAAFT